MTSDIKFVLSSNNSNIYDEVPYESYSYPLSNPFHMMTLGHLFGMNPASPAKARILELGCAAGGNLIPHAVNYPESEFVGVDLSKVEIDEAINTVSNLGLKNIKFYNCSITELNKDIGKFDYIICHGVLSWVPVEVRDKIFVVCKEHLTTEGITYISYNTLPGWNMIRTIRDMMLYHGNTFNNIEEKIKQARALLEFVKDSLEHSKSPYAEVLKTEAALLAKQNDYYLCHDHLEEENKQYYFHEFMKKANDNGLQYLADCNISTMFLGNMPPKVVEKLQVINDIVRIEQYMDFITNRRFRSTLLCHNCIKLNRRIESKNIANYNMILNIIPEKAIETVDLKNTEENISFFYKGNQESKISTKSEIMKAIFYVFYENLNNPISFDKLMNDACQKITVSREEAVNEFLNNAVSLLLQGHMTITLQDARNAVNLNKPKIAKYSFHQAVNTTKLWVTNLLHEVIGINNFEKFVFRYMDGKRNKQQLLDLMMQHIKKGDITLSKEEQKLEDLIAIRKEITNLINSAINKASASALLL